MPSYFNRYWLWFADTSDRKWACGNALFLAAAGRKIGTVRVLLDQGAEMTTCEGVHRDALQTALAKGGFEIAILLPRVF